MKRAETPIEAMRRHDRHPDVIVLADAAGRLWEFLWRDEQLLPGQLMWTVVDGYRVLVFDESGPQGLPHVLAVDPEEDL